MKNTHYKLQDSSKKGEEETKLDQEKDFLYIKKHSFNMTRKLKAQI